MTVFCCSLTSCYPVTLFRCFLDDFGFVLVDPVIIGISYCYIPHTLLCCCQVLVFQNVLIFFLDHIATSINIACSLFVIMDLLLLLSLLKYWYFATVAIQFLFCTFLLSTNRSFSLCTQQWYVFADSLRAGSGRNVLILLASCQQTI